MDVNLAIKYFEDAIKETDETIEECSDDLKAQLINQKKHFETAVKIMVDWNVRHGQHPKYFGTYDYNDDAPECLTCHSTDNPGEIMIAMMPLKENISGTRIRPGENKETKCPRCSRVCYANPELIEDCLKIYSGRMIPLCTRCGLEGRLNKTVIPQWLKQINKTSLEISRMVLDSFKT